MKPWQIQKLRFGGFIIAFLAMAAFVSTSISSFAQNAPPQAQPAHPGAGSQPQRGLPQGHPPMQGQRGQGRPGVGQGGPGRPQKGPSNPIRRGPPKTAPVHEQEESGHSEAHHCPGHGPTDPPGHINWWHGLVGVNNEKAELGGINSLLWRYENPKDPCDVKNEPPPFLASILNFGLLAFLVVRFGRKPLAEALAGRKASIMKEIETASLLKKQSEERLANYREQLAQMQETLKAMRDEYRIQGEIERKHVLKEAEERRTRLKKDAEFRIAQEAKAAKIQLLEEATEEAVQLAEQIIKQKLVKEDHDRNAEEYLRSISASIANANRINSMGGRA